MIFSQDEAASLFEDILILFLIAKYIRNKAARIWRFISKIGDASFGFYLSRLFSTAVWGKLFVRNDYTFIVDFVVVFATSCLMVWSFNRIAPAKISKWVGLGMK